MVFSSLIYRNAARIGLLLALVFSVTSGGAQLHDVLVEPSNVLYSSTCEISDGSEHMLVASTVDDASPIATSFPGFRALMESLGAKFS